MLSAVWQRRMTILLVVAALLVAAGFLWRLAARDPAISFLPSASAADWIIYPLAPAANMREGIEQHASFRTTLHLRQRPAAAPLHWRARGRMKLRVNGKAVALANELQGNWKLPREVDVARFLREGENEISADVVHRGGPPALWLVLQTDVVKFATGSDWNATLDGAVELPAQIAGSPLVPQAGNKVAGGEHAPTALRECLPALLVLAGFFFVLALASKRCRAWLAAKTGKESALSSVAGWFIDDAHPTRLPLVAVIVLWLALFLNNLQSIDAPLGFDVEGHLEYLSYVQHRRALPLAGEGWKTDQPPLFYVAAAGLLQCFGLTHADPAAGSLLRLFSLAVGITQIIIAAACIALIFPRQSGAQLGALVVYAFLPMHLYVFHHLTNVTFASFWGTAALYYALLILREQDAAFRLYVSLGICLGAALLSQITALVLAAVVLGVLAGRLVARGERSPRIWLCTVAMPLLLCLLISGWHYGRVWARFGTPLVGTYDSPSGVAAWWQDPGYSTAAHFLRFGQSVVEPFYSAFSGCADGLYSTLWGDGLWSGLASRDWRPPWNYDIMAAGYLLALAPSLLILIGALSALGDLIRRPSAQSYLVLGLVFSYAFAILFNYLRLPYSGSGKAYYGMLAVVPMCALAGRGIAWLAKTHGVVRIALVVVIGTWAVASYVSFWVRATAPRTQVWLIHRLMLKGQFETAARNLETALAAAPTDALALKETARFLASLGQWPAAARQLQLALKHHSERADLYVALAAVLSNQDKLDQAIANLRRASELGPEHPTARLYLGSLLNRQRRSREAIPVLREALRVLPTDPAVHNELAVAFAREGQAAQAIAQLRVALRFQPDRVEVLDHLAWLLATHEDARFRDSAEAIRLARRACELAGNQDAPYLDTLAAAYANAGRFGEAEDALHKALEQMGPNSAVYAALPKRLSQYQRREPMREHPRNSTRILGQFVLPLGFE
jgi:tetratricopeptide (TPR) repeat protein